jgi:hypothetical protein
MPWHGSSRTVSRKNLARAALVALLLVPAVTAVADLQHETAVTPSGELIVVSIRVAGADVDELFSGLRDGMRARVEYRIRVAAPRSRPFRLLGDRLLREFRPAVEVRWDPFLASFVLESSDGETVEITEESELYARLFALDSYRIPLSALAPADQVVVETRVAYTPVVFAPGLSILSLFPRNRTLLTPWARRELPPLPDAKDAEDTGGTR